MTNKKLNLPDLENDNDRFYYFRIFGSKRKLRYGIKTVCHILPEFNKDFINQVSLTNNVFHNLGDYEIAILVERTLLLHKEHQSNFLQTLKIVAETQKSLSQEEKKKALQLFHELDNSLLNKKYQTIKTNLQPLKNLGKNNKKLFDCHEFNKLGDKSHYDN